MACVDHDHESLKRELTAKLSSLKTDRGTCKSAIRQRWLL